MALDWVDQIAIGGVELDPVEAGSLGPLRMQQHVFIIGDSKPVLVVEAVRSPAQRALGDDVVDGILTLASNTALGDGVVPDKARIGSEFPYFGEPYTRAEQADVTPAPQRSQKQRNGYRLLGCLRNTFVLAPNPRLQVHSRKSEKWGSVIKFASIKPK